MNQASTKVSTKISVPKRREITKTPRSPETLPEIGLAATYTFKNQKDVGEFIHFIVGALERNRGWLNGLVDKQPDFRCVLMVGSGPNRFQIQENIYPLIDKQLKLEVVQRDSEDYDKIAIVALLKLSNSDIDALLKYIKTHLLDNIRLKNDLLKGKEMGVNYAVLRSLSDVQYRVMDRIVLAVAPKTTKRRRNDKALSATPVKKIKRFMS